MKASNTIIFNGYVGNVSEVKQYGDVTIREFSVSINFKNKAGDKRTLWKSCKMFGKNIEYFSGLEKGDFVKVSGEMDVECWTGQDGQQKSKEVVIVDTIEWVSFRKQQENTTHPGNTQMQQMMQQPIQPQYQQPQVQYQYQQPTPQSQTQYQQPVQQPVQGQLPFGEEKKGDLPF